MSLPAPSTATAADMSTVISPSAIGVTLKVYSWSSTLTNVSAVPLSTTISSILNPLTSSLNVAVIGMVDAFVGSLSLELIDTVGSTRSQ